MAEKELTDIYFWRETGTHRDGSVPGVLQVGKVRFPTIERGVRYVNLKVGNYVMQHSTKNTGRTVKCLRPVEQAYRTLLIHDALNDNSNNLTGCIGPGMSKKASPGMGIRRSAEAMEAIWKLLGGWKNGKTVTLHVTGNVPGEARTKATWQRGKK